MEVVKYLVSTSDLSGSVFLVRTLTLAILFLTVLKAAVRAKPGVLGTLPSLSVILALWFVFLTSPLVSGNFLSASSFPFPDLIYQCYIEFLKQIH